ncbi:MAG: PilZ domain-containing protein [Betaproteobacteria bacterium]
MQNKRRHTRFKLDLVELDGNMFLIDDVEILDISLGGVSLKVDRGLNIGKEYLITLAEKGKSVDVKGIVVHSAIKGTEVQTNGERVTIHTARLKFKEGQAAKIARVLNSIQQLEKEEAPAAAAPDRRLHVRFQFTIPLETVLSHSAQFTVKNIGLSGMLIQSDQALEINNLIPMGLSLNADDPVNIIGRIVTCQMNKGDGRALYEMGVEFSDFTDKGRTLLKKFIDDLAITKENPEAAKADK